MTVKKSSASSMYVPDGICCLREVERGEGHLDEGGQLGGIAEARLKLLVVIGLRMGVATGSW